jgi:hypothetical protein
MQMHFHVLQLVLLLAHVSAQCPSGYTGPDDGPCIECPAGTFKFDIGNEACTACPTAKFSVTVGATDGTYCVACPAYSNAPAQTSAATSCTCNAGFTGPDGGTCTACAAGTYKSTPGSEFCTDCVAEEGSTQQEGATACVTVTSEAYVDLRDESNT